MATIEDTIIREDVVRSARYVTAGSVIEAVAGAGTATLAILGLAGVLPIEFAAIATIAVGVGLLFQGGAIAARFDDILTETELAHLANRSIASGMAAESVAGVAGTVLGILALFHVASLTLMPIAMIVFGAALLVGTGAAHDLNHFVWNDQARANDQLITREAVTVVAGGQFLLGAAAVTLGILGVLAIVPLTLTLAGLIVVGGAALFNGTALSIRMRLNLNP